MIAAYLGYSKEQRAPNELELPAFISESLQIDGASMQEGLF